MPTLGPLGPPRLKKRLAEKRPLIGMWITSCDSLAVETSAHIGYDVLLIDAEHTAFTIRDIERTVIAAQGSPAIPIVRMPGNDRIAVKQVLDLGVEGIVVPMVRNAKEARRLVSYGMYPPLGERGIGPRRAQFLMGGPWEYQRAANEEIVCLIPQIEHRDAVEEIDAIASLQGIGGLFLGPSDLSLSMGLPGEYDHPDVVAAKDRVWEASRRHDVPFAVATTGPEDAEMWIRRGAELVFVGSDMGFMMSGAKATLDTFRALRGD